MFDFKSIGTIHCSANARLTSSQYLLLWIPPSFQIGPERTPLHTTPPHRNSENTSSHHPPTQDLREHLFTPSLRTGPQRTPFHTIPPHRNSENTSSHHPLTQELRKHLFTLSLHTGPQRAPFHTIPPHRTSENTSLSQFLLHTEEPHHSTSPLRTSRRTSRTSWAATSRRPRWRSVSGTPTTWRSGAGGQCRASAPTSPS